MNIPHTTDETTTIQGYTIPKGSNIVLGIYNIHRSPIYWQDPDVFYPERWLSQDGKFVKNENLFAFGIGE